MTDKEIVQGAIGKDGSYDLKFSSGKIVATANYTHSPVGVGVNVLLDSGAVLDLIASVIPGHFEDGAIAAAKVLLAAM